ncbi:hypothetical protein D0A36_22290 [Xanthomonas campestris]|nr:hypothetical protein D0A36_22290 [Xanthomonas campestris]RFF52904.1 hypothetical protein D0A41_22330 [Xanthomonas campestris]
MSYLVLPRAAKYLQTVGYVMGELLRRFAEFMARPQTALIITRHCSGAERRLRTQCLELRKHFPSDHSYRQIRG